INRAQLVGDQALFRGLRTPPGAKGFGRTWGGDGVQTTLLGVAIAIILALVTALVGPLFVDWNSYRGEFETRASRLTGLDFRVTGAIDARLLPTPTLTLEGLEFGRPEEGSKVRARLLRIEFALGALARGEWRIADAHLEGPEFSAGLDGSGRLAWPVPKLGFSLESVSIARLHIQDGRASLADAANDGHLVLEKLEFTGELRSLAGPAKGRGPLRRRRPALSLSHRHQPDRRGQRRQGALRGRSDRPAAGRRSRCLDLDRARHAALRRQRSIRARGRPCARGRPVAHHRTVACHQPHQGRQRSGGIGADRIPIRPG